MPASSPRLIALLLLGSIVAIPGHARAADAPLPRREARVVETVEAVAPRYTPRRHWGCSDRYSCAPLYGAYGPYGGVGYWGAYTGWYR